MIDMRRREFITLLGGAAAARPLAARAQQPPMPVVGFLRSATLADVPHWVTAFRQGLKEAGFVEGQNVAIEFRSADNHPDRLPALVADLIRQPVAVIVANTDAALAAKAATTTVPIVFAGGGDPVKQGLVASLNQPGGNVTGLVYFSAVLGAKRLELLRQFVPRATKVAVLVNPNTLVTEAERRDVQAAAQAIGQQLIIFDVSSDRDIETAFATFVQRGAGALLVGTGGFLNSNRERIAAVANRHALPAKATGPAFRMPIAKPASTPGEFSRARSRPTYLSCSPPNSSLCSISRPLRHSALKCRPRCSRLPMK
jgi:putative ABC transport system substrate-binding protein